ncbi:MAG TPA: lysylphosphatidylglycerol synthase transmembrane domain-containing protein [Gemmatimonadaceae bacterium]|nr:lysylphosphatidylglycerol synthase transmembrane domain-containing protein [Gemmatimonadaceae bacterium]
MNFRRWLITVLSFCAVIAVSVYVMRSSRATGGAQLSLPPSAHLLALAATIIDILARGMKLRLSAASLRIPLRLSTALRVSLGGDFGASITPARTGAEPARFLILSEAGVTTSGALLILFTELFLEMLSLAVIALVLALTFDPSGAMVTGVVGLVGLYAFFVMSVSFIGYALSKRNASGPVPAWARRLGLHAGRWRTVQRSLRSVRHSVGELRHARAGPMIGALIMSIAHVLARLMVLPVIVLTVAPGAPLADLVLWPLAILYGGSVAPAPGGGGLVEVAFKAALGGVIPVAFFGAALLWWRFYTFYIYLIGGALVAGNTVLRALRRLGGRNNATMSPDTAPGRVAV